MFFKKSLQWKRNCSSGNRAQKRRLERPNSFCSKTKKYLKKIVWRIYFSPNCFIGHIKCKNDETARNSHRESEATYLEVRRLLRPNRFFQTYISFKFFRWHKECNFDKTAEQLSSEVQKVFPKIRERSKKWKKILTSNVFPPIDPLANGVQLRKPCQWTSAKKEDKWVKTQRVQRKNAQL